MDHIGGQVNISMMQGLYGGGAGSKGERGPNMW